MIHTQSCGLKVQRAEKEIVLNNENKVVAATMQVTTIKAAADKKIISRLTMQANCCLKSFVCCMIQIWAFSQQPTHHGLLVIGLAVNRKWVPSPKTTNTRKEQIKQRHKINLPTTCNFCCQNANEKKKSILISVEMWNGLGNVNCSKPNRKKNIVI